MIHSRNVIIKLKSQYINIILYFISNQITSNQIKSNQINWRMKEIMKNSNKLEILKKEFFWLTNELKRVYSKDNIFSLLKPKGVMDIIVKAIFVVFIIISVDHLSNMTTYTRHSITKPGFAKMHDLTLVDRRDVDDSAFIDLYFDEPLLGEISDIQLYTNGEDALLETRYIVITPKGEGLVNLLEDYEARIENREISGVTINWAGLSEAIRQAAFFSGLDKGYNANYMIVMLNPYDTNDPYNFPFIHLAPNSFANIETFGLKDYTIPYEDVHLLR